MPWSRRQNRELFTICGEMDPWNECHACRPGGTLQVSTGFVVGRVLAKPGNDMLAEVRHAQAAS